MPITAPITWNQIKSNTGFARKIKGFQALLVKFQLTFINYV